MTTINWQEFESYVQKVMADEHIVGAAVAVSQNGQTIYQQGFGVRSLETKAPVTPETIFGIASVTKSFTALMIMHLASEGRLSVRDPVTKYLPELKFHAVEDMETITIHHLLSHTTGMPPMRRRQELYTFKQHMDYLASEEVEHLGKPGAYCSYCNDAYLLLGAIIERLTGRLYRRVMTDQIVDALQMHRSTYCLQELAQLENVSVPYIYSKKEQTHREQPWPRLGNYEVGGGIRSNVLDLLKYGQVYINGGRIGDRSFVRPELIREMWQPVYQIGRSTHYCYGLRTTLDHEGVTLVEHGGGQPGVSANFGFVPEKGLVVAVLTNVTGVSANAIWLAAVNAALGLPVEHARSVESHYEMSAPQLSRFVGTYKSNEGGNLTVALAEGGLQVTLEDETYPLRASAEDTLVFGAKGERPLKFHFDADGNAWAVLMGLRMLRKV